MSNYYALIPASGVGSRFGSNTPKQYLIVNRKPLIYYIIKTFLSEKQFKKVFLVLSPQDEYWHHLNCMNYFNESEKSRLEVLFDGGETRADSVLNGLNAIQNQIEKSDWICVHDCARFCLTSELIQRLIDNIGNHAVGGILALPVADTLKRSKQNDFNFPIEIEQTVDRDRLYQAQTPQQFRYELLRQALIFQKEQNFVATDEAQAIERYGYTPVLVLGDLFNFKVTYPQDLARCEQILTLQGKINTND